MQANSVPLVWKINQYSKWASFLNTKSQTQNNLGQNLEEIKQNKINSNNKIHKIFC